MKLGFYQFRPRFGKVAQNLATVVKALDGAEADIIVLPELAFTGYHFRHKAELLELSEDLACSKVITELSALCRNNGFHIVCGFAERVKDDCYNSGLLIGPDGLRHSYRKLHLFNEEKNYFTPGDIPLTVHDIDGVKMGIMVCFDWAFPEVARSLSLLGADVICHPSNLVLSFCQQTMLSRCLENRIYAVTCNRYGADKRPHGELKFTGNSQIVAPGGELLHRAYAQREQLYITEINPLLAREKHITPLNHLITDRRPEFYQV